MSGSMFGAVGRSLSGQPATYLAEHANQITAASRDADSVRYVRAADAAGPTADTPVSSAVTHSEAGAGARLLDKLVRWLSPEARAEARMNKHQALIDRINGREGGPGVQPRLEPATDAQVAAVRAALAANADRTPMAGIGIPDNWGRRV